MPSSEGIGPSGRLRRLRSSFLATQPSISVARAKAYTDVYRENPGLPPVLLRARAFRRACETAPVAIFDDELIVGHPAGRRRAGIMTPEIAWRWVRDELDTCATRPQDPYVIDDADKRILTEEIFPYWEGRSLEEAAAAQVAELGVTALTFESGLIDCEVKFGSGGGDTNPGYADILFKKGFDGIRREALDRLRGLDPARSDEFEQIDFLRGVATVSEGVCLLASRYSREALRLAALETDPVRRAELEEIAAVCKRVPAKPPRSLHEALQAVWFTNGIMMLEENQSGVSIGRIDQYAYPFFAADLAAGRLTEERAKDLLGSFLVKFNEVPWLLSEVGARYFAGYMPFQTMTVGGQTRAGGDATNAMTLMLLDCVRELQLYQPGAAARVHNASPQEYLERCVDVIETGCGFPALYYDDATIRMLMSKGIAREDALDYCIMGCVEPQVQGRLYQWTSVCYTNFPAAVEFALLNGRSRVLGEVVGVETGDPTAFATFEEFEAAVKQQIAYLTRVCAELTNLAMRAHRQSLPKPLMSSLVEGCVESGKDVTEGGAHYNCGPGLVWVGLANYANSMAAVKRLIYEERRFTMAELLEALNDDFVGHEPILRACLEAPKYGNDDDYVDHFAGDALGCAAELGESYTFANGGRMSIGTLSVSTNTPYGLAIGALPDGRRAGAPLSDGISPSQGTDTKGPTAVIRSVNKFKQDVMAIGVLHNMKLDPAMLSSPEGRQALIALIRTHGILGGAQIQFNCITQERLLAAQRNPEEHRGMVVRVAGYSAFFTELCREVQDEIISRTTQAHWRRV